MRGNRQDRGIDHLADEVVNVMRRAVAQLRNGRGGPAIVEVPQDLWNAECRALNYKPVLRTRYGPDPDAVKEAAKLLANAKRPVIYAGQGVHWAEAWPQLKPLAEHLAMPVCTSLEGKRRFRKTIRCRSARAASRCRSRCAISSTMPT